MADTQKATDSQAATSSSSLEGSPAAATSKPHVSIPPEQSTPPNTGTPSPHVAGVTPGSPCPAFPPPSPTHNLHPQLVQEGWRRYWSKSQNMDYYFNKFTKESIWEMPQLFRPTKSHLASMKTVQPEKDPLGLKGLQPDKDPLGLKTLQPEKDPLGLTRDCTGDQAYEDLQAAVKRRRASGESATVPPKKPKQEQGYSVTWDFSVQSNAIMWPGYHHGLPPTCPDLELLRQQKTNLLRQTYAELTRKRLHGMEPPKDSFNRWLLERKVRDKGDDPMLPSDCAEEISQSMFRELADNIPIKFIKPKYSSDARKQLSEYAYCAKKIITSSKMTLLPFDETKKVSIAVESVFSWLRENSATATYEDYLARTAHLKRQCHSVLVKAAKAPIERVCAKMYTEACQTAKFLKEKRFLDQKEIQENYKGTRQSFSQRFPPVKCHPCLMTVDSLQHCDGQVTHVIENQVARVNFKGQVVSINLSHLVKLEQLYKANCYDQNYVFFLNRVFCMLKRYQTFFGVTEDEGQSTQSALPVSVFQCLSRVFGVTFECFASPLNCYYKQYCSMFPDTDGYFGSRGTILDFRPHSGSFEANPPFCEELMEAMVDHFESCLGAATEPLSFIVFVPDVRDPPPQALMRLESSRFKREQIVIPACEHDLRHGFQHCEKKDQHIKCCHGTVVVFLQNEPGFRRWGPTTERINDLMLAFQSRKSLTNHR